MAIKNVAGGVKPGVISVPAKKASTPTPAANGSAMPKSDINPFIGKGKK